jgi:FkbM family methyltransferase
MLRWLGRQTWIPGGQGRIVRFLADYHKCKPYPFEVDFFGLRYRGDLSEYIDWSVFMYGSYEYAVLSLLQELCRDIRRQRPTITFYDVGANVGQHSLFMSRLADQVIAFEPCAPIRNSFQDKIVLNAIENVKILPFGLGAVDEEKHYYPGAGGNSGLGTLLNHRGTNVADAVQVEVRNGDRLLAEHGFPSMDILKIDVEGFEPFVLRGLAERIRADRPVIIMELSDASRRLIQSEHEFYSLFYQDALFAGVQGGPGRRFELTTFNYEQSHEVLVATPDWRAFITANLRK